jgi:integrase
VDGKQRWESWRTLDEARRAKAARATDIGRDEFEERSRITLHEYAREWIECYQGTGRRGFPEETRSEYRALLDKHALSHFLSHEDRARPFPRVKGDDGEAVETMELVVERVHQSHRLMFEVLAATGPRRSEFLVLEGRHLALDGKRPHVKVRQRVRHRRGEVVSLTPTAYAS